MEYRPKDNVVGMPTAPTSPTPLTPPPVPPVSPQPLDVAEYWSHRENADKFVHTLSHPDPERHNAITGLKTEEDRLRLEIARLEAQLLYAQGVINHAKELEELREAVALYIRGGAYRLEHAQGLIAGKSLAEMVVAYLHRERRSWSTRLAHAFGRGVI